MRKVIQDRKRELKKANAPGKAASVASPLDDPIILVQNLPDYKPKAQRPVESLPPPPPISAETTATTMEPSGHSETDELAGSKEDEVAVAVPPANLEFERMVLQLKSVVESGSIDDDDDDGEDEEGTGDQPTQNSPIPEEELDDLSTSTLPPSYSAVPALTSIDVSVLEDHAFRSALGALLAADLPEDEQLRLMQSVPAEHKQALGWMRKFIRSVVSP